MEKANRDDVAVFVDFENVYVSVREKFDVTPNFELIMDRCEDYGRIVIARAYADWYRYPRVTSALFANGVEPMYVPTYYYDRDVGRTGRPIKNSVDIHLCIDAMRTLYSQPNIMKFVLVTGDRDFIPLVNAIRQHGKDVIVIGIGGAASAHLAQSADEFLFYEQIADLKSQAPQRQMEDGRRPEERRERSERPERQDRPRPERQPRPELVTPVADAPQDTPIEEPVEEPVEVQAAEPAEVAPQAPSPYETLVDAVKLARQRGFVVNLGSLKVVMRELDSTFHESKVKDASGRGFSKFKDFVKEAERQGKVQIFTNGTVTEIFLAGEDPKVMSQFAEDEVTQQAERELETELEREAQAQPITTQPVADATGLDAAEATEPSETSAVEEVPVTVGSQEETGRQSFDDREWDVFRGSMSQFTEPVRFAEIFNALRGLRNQEVVELTNNELKDLVKQAINRGMLQRTGRGARAYYRLSSQYRVPRPENGELAQDYETSADGGQTSGESSPQVAYEPTGAEVTSPATRRARSYGVIVAALDVSTTQPADVTEPDTTSSPQSSMPELVAADLEAANEEASAPEAEAEAPRTGRRRTRRKPAAQTEGAGAPGEQPEPSTAQGRPAEERPEAQAAADATPLDEAGSSAEQAGATARENGARRRRRRKPATGEATAQTDTAPEAELVAPEAQEKATPPRRRRRKAPDASGGEGNS